MNNNELNQLSKAILDACLTVHRDMGPGLLEAIYEYCLLKEFSSRHIWANHQVYLPYMK